MKIRNKRAQKTYINNCLILTFLGLLVSCASERSNTVSEEPKSAYQESLIPEPVFEVKTVLENFREKPILLIYDGRYSSQKGKLKSEAQQNRKLELRESIKKIMVEIFKVEKNKNLFEQNNKIIPSSNLDELHDLEVAFTEKYSGLDLASLYSDVLGSQFSGCGEQYRTIGSCVEKYTETNGEPSNLDENQYKEKLASDKELRSFVWSALFLVKSNIEIKRMDEENYKITVTIPTPDIYKKTEPVSKFYE